MKKNFLIILIVVAIIGYISYPTIISLKEEYFARKDVEEKFNNYKDNKNNASNITIDENEELQNNDLNNKEQTNQEESPIIEEKPIDETTDKKTTEEKKETTSSSSKKTNSTSNKKPSSSSNTNKKPSSSSTTTTTTNKTYAKLSLMDTGANDDIKVSQSGNNFTLTGTMEEKEPTSGINSRSYLRLKITAPEIYKKEVLEKAKVTLLYNNKTFTQAADNFLESTSSTSKTYFYIDQEFMKGMTISILVDWGNGKEIKYSFTFNVTVEDK